MRKKLDFKNENLNEKTESVLYIQLKNMKPTNALNEGNQ